MINVYFPEHIRAGGSNAHIYEAITKGGEETWNLDDLDLAFVFYKLRYEMGDDEGADYAKRLAERIRPGACSSYHYPLGDKYDIVTVHHA